MKKRRSWERRQGENAKNKLLMNGGNNFTMDDINITQRISENLPSEIKNLHRFVLWRYEQSKNGRPTKVPYRDVNKKAATNRTNTWNNFAGAMGIYENNLERALELRGQGLTQAEMAKELGISQPGVSRLFAKIKAAANAKCGRPTKPGTKLRQLARSSVEVTRELASQETVEEINALLGRMYSIEEIAAALQVTARSVQGYLKNGKLRGVKVGGAWKVSAANLKSFMEGK